MLFNCRAKGVRTVRTPLQGGFVEEPNTEFLIPARQDTIQFQEKPLVVVRLPDEQPGVVLRWVCENLHLAIHGQVERIKRTEVIADDLVYVRVQTDGGPQIMPTLVLRAVPYQNMPGRRRVADKF